MNIGSLCNREAITVSRAMTVSDTAAVMRRHHIGEVLVLDDSGDDALIGIVTDRDITVEVVASRADPDKLAVGELVRRPLLVVDEQETCEDTVRLMLLHAVRRMAVVGEDGRLVGVVTFDDLLPHFSAPLAQLSCLAGLGRQREAKRRE